MSEINALDRPKVRQPCPDYKVKPRNSKQTLRELLTENETKHHLIKLLKQLAVMRPKGPWQDYLSFYGANMSGDVETLKPEVKAYVQKMFKDLKSEYEKQQGDQTSAVEKGK